MDPSCGEAYNGHPPPNCAPLVASCFLLLKAHFVWQKASVFHRVGFESGDHNHDYHYDLDCHHHNYDRDHQNHDDDCDDDGDDDCGYDNDHNSDWDYNHDRNYNDGQLLTQEILLLKVNDDQPGKWLQKVPSLELLGGT